MDTRWHGLPSAFSGAFYQHCYSHVLPPQKIQVLSGKNLPRFILRAACLVPPASFSLLWKYSSCFSCSCVASTLPLRFPISTRQFYHQRYTPERVFYISLCVDLFALCSYIVLVQLFIGAYFHPCFVKENRTLCRQIVRPKSVNTRNSRSRPLQSCKSLTEEPYYESTDIFNESNINQANLQTLNICSSTSDANYQYTPFMLGQSFDPLSDHRGSTSRLISMPVLSKDLFTSSMFSGRTGVVSPSVDQDIPDNNVSSSDIQQETATQSLFRSLQQAMYGSHLLPRDDETPDLHQRELVRNVEDFQIDPSGSIYSMSVGNSTAMNFEASHNDPQHIIYGTASIQELEAYSDSIITLFGGGSGDFLD